MRSDLWEVVHTERADLVDDLTGLSAAGWETPSLCAGWDVGDVVTHLAATATLSLRRFAVELVLAGLSPDRIVDRQIRVGRARPAAKSLHALRSAISSTASPPQSTITRVIEIIVHGEDIRRPLQIGHEYSIAHIAEALDYLACDRRSGGRTRLSGLELHATDADVVLGQGRRVEGPAVSLLVAAAGRRAALSDLTGPGLQQLTDQLS